MGKKFTNTGKTDIGFGGDLKVKPGEVVEIPDEVLERKAAAIKALVESGNLSEGKKAETKPKVEEPVEEPKVRKK